MARPGNARRRRSSSVAVSCSGTGTVTRLVVAGDTGHVLQIIGRVTRLHERANHVGLLTLFMRLADGAIGKVATRLGKHACRHASARDGPMADDTRVQIAVDRKRQRTRDGRCRHNEQIGTGALRAQGIALADAKPVLPHR